MIVPSAVRRAFLAPTSEIVRRVELYEQDGQTPFEADLWDEILIDGAVSLDLSSDERRTLEVTLANPDSRLDPTVDKLWYDKIVKPFYGVRVPPRSELPRVAIVEEYGLTGQGGALVDLLAAVAEVVFLPTAQTLADVADYDVLISLSHTETQKSGLLVEAHAAGKSILTCAPFATRGSAPLLLGAVDASVTSPATETLSPVVGDQPWAPFAVIGEPRRRIVTAAPGATIDVTSASGPAVISYEGEQDGPRWAHTHLHRFSSDAFPSSADRDSCATMLGQLLRWLDIAVGGRVWEMQIGEFLIDAASADAESFGEVALTCRDMVKRCRQSKLVTATTFSKGRSIESIIETMAANSSIARRRLPVTGQSLDRDMTWESDTERWEIMKELATSFNYDLRFDSTGTLVMTEFSDPLSAPVSLDLTVGAQGNLVSRGLRTSDSRLFNHVVVVGEGSDSSTPPVWAEAINDNPRSPSRVAELGDRVIRHTSPLISTLAQARELANSMLSIAALEEFELDFATPLLPWIEPGQILRLTDEAAGTWGPNRFLISTLSYPLDLSPMSGSGKRVINVG